MEPSFSAASLVFLATPARAEIIAPDLLLLLGLGRRWLDVCKLFQEVKAHCLAGQFHCEDLLADVLHVHFTGLEGFTDVWTQRERLEAFFRWRHLHQLVRRIATVAGHSCCIVECTVQGGESLYIPLGLEANTQLFQVSKNVGWLNSNRPDTVQEFFKNHSLASVAQVTAFLQECPQPALFRRVLAVEGVLVFQQMFLIGHIIGLILLPALRLYKKVDGFIDHGNINDFAVKRLCVPDIRVKLIAAQNVIAFAFMTGDFRKGEKFVL